MGTYSIVKNRILSLYEEKQITINKLSTESGIPPSTIKNILYYMAKAKIPELLQ